jgi:hypothetical protein
MSDVFQVTLNQFLKIETQIQFIKLRLTYLQIKTRIRLQKRLHDALIVNNCNKIKLKLTQSKKNVVASLILRRKSASVFDSKVFAQN